MLFLEKFQLGVEAEEIMKMAEGVDQGNKLSVNSSTAAIPGRFKLVRHPSGYLGVPYRC